MPTLERGGSHILDRYLTADPHNTHAFIERGNLCSQYVTDVLTPFAAFVKDGSANNRILDVAGGNGDVSQVLTNNFGFQAVSFDLSHAGSQLARVKQQTSVRGNMLDLPFADGSFAAIHCKDALVHIDDYNKLLGGFNRVLEPHGKVLIFAEDLNRLSDFRYTTADNPEIPKSQEITSLDEYKQLASKLEGQPGITIFPPYFTISKDRLSTTALKNGFSVVCTYEEGITPLGDEKDWYVLGEKRFVMLLKKDPHPRILYPRATRFPRTEMNGHAA